MTTELNEYVAIVEAELPRYLNAQPSIPAELKNAMHYALMAGGKRIRPALVLMTNDVLGGDRARAINTACAMEMVHTYSLIHDDLPAMDDDELRRGKPTLHIEFNEAIAILAGDALQSLAIETISVDENLPVDLRLKLIQQVTKAIGPAGMVAGQVHDMAAENLCISEEQLVQMHHRKTGDLISASVMAGAAIGGASAEQQTHLGQFGYALGLAFQVRDDLLDVLSTTEQLGKPQGSDLRQQKTTFTTLFGVDGAKHRLQDLHQEAISALGPLGTNAAPLRSLAQFIVDRIH